MAEVEGSELVARALKAQGTDHVFTVVGGPVLALLTPSEAELARLMANPTVVPPWILLVAVVALPIIAWHITLLVFGFRHATKLSGGRLAGGAVALIVGAEIVSKVALALL